MLGLHDIIISVTGSMDDDSDDVSVEETVDADDIEFDPTVSVDPEEHPLGVAFADLLASFEDDHNVTIKFDAYDDDSGRKAIELDVSNHSFEDLSDLEEFLEEFATAVVDWITGN